MACADTLEGSLHPAPQSFDARRTRSLRHRVGGAVQLAWRAHWRRRAARATLHILRSLDDRTLKDIGIDRSEIGSVVCGARDRRISADGSDGPRGDRAVSGCW
jgi:uncharacterized protein YjiS (DUF1127 family)